MTILIATFLAGVAVGLFGYRFYIINILGRWPFTRCDYCEFWIQREQLFPGRKSKRKSKKDILRYTCGLIHWYLIQLRAWPIEIIQRRRHREAIRECLVRLLDKEVKQS